MWFGLMKVMSYMETRPNRVYCVQLLMINFKIKIILLKLWFNFIYIQYCKYSTVFSIRSTAVEGGRVFAWSVSVVIQSLFVYFTLSAFLVSIHFSVRSCLILFVFWSTCFIYSKSQWREMPTCHYYFILPHFPV